MPVKLQSKLPAQHGLTDHVARRLEAGELVVAIVVVDARKIELDRDDGQQTVKARLRRLEVVEGDDALVLQRIAMRAHEERLGQTVLPFETEEAVRAAFRGWALADDGTPVPPDSAHADDGDDDDTPPATGVEFREPE